jgi:hypothetical protein
MERMLFEADRFEFDIDQLNLRSDRTHHIPPENERPDLTSRENPGSCGRRFPDWRAGVTDLRVFRWALDENIKAGETRPSIRIKYIDNRGEREISLPPTHDFKWTVTTREQHVGGRHPHVDILDAVFVETVGPGGRRRNHQRKRHASFPAKRVASFVEQALRCPCYTRIDRIKLNLWLARMTFCGYSHLFSPHRASRLENILPYYKLC